jgi:DNA polymerase-3 subunit alpha
MSDLFSDLPEALENNYNFPYRSNFRPLFSKPILPNISSSGEGNASDIIRKNSLDGLKEKFNKFFDLKEKIWKIMKNF